MPWAITIEITDCNVPTVKLQGAMVSANSLLAFADANGQVIVVIADTLTQFIVAISQSGSTTTAANGYISKNFTLNRSNADTIQEVCLNPAPPPVTGEPIKCFIVTATTGASDSAEVIHLRQLRDRVATVSDLGGDLIGRVYRDYQQFSPAIATELEQDTLARQATLLVIVRPLLAWYSLAGVLALEPTNSMAIQQAAQEAIKACPRYLGRTSILTLLETMSTGKPLPLDTHPLLLNFAPQIQAATRLQFASWAIFEPLVRTWRSATNGLEIVDEVAQWLATAPLQVLTPPSDPQFLRQELAALASFFDFSPKARLQLGERLATAWPHAVDELERAEFLSAASISKEEH